MLEQRLWYAAFGLKPLRVIGMAQITTFVYRRLNNRSGPAPFVAGGYIFRNTQPDEISGQAAGHCGFGRSCALFETEMSALRKP